MTERNSIKTGKLDKKYLMQMPVEVRIVRDLEPDGYLTLDLTTAEPPGEEMPLRP